MNWTAHCQRHDDRTTVSHLTEGARVLTSREVIALWRDNPSFRSFFTATLTSSPAPAFFWETPPLRRATLGRPFAFAQVNAPALVSITSDPAPFSTHFAARPGAEVHVFPNLGGDALLVVPGPLRDPASYAHLAVFLRNAPPGQTDAFWQAVGQAMESRLSDEPLWLSTAGLGVSWLHLRLDSRPKYYRHQPYTREV